MGAKMAKFVPPMWQTVQVCVPGIGMWPPGSVLGVVHAVVLWQDEQSPVFIWGKAGLVMWSYGVVLSGRVCNAGVEAPR